jgi:hypothetical protein
MLLLILSLSVYRQEIIIFYLEHLGLEELDKLKAEYMDKAIIGNIKMWVGSEQRIPPPRIWYGQSVYQTMCPNGRNNFCVVCIKLR